MGLEFTYPSCLREVGVQRMKEEKRSDGVKRVSEGRESERVVVSKTTLVVGDDGREGQRAKEKRQQSQYGEWEEREGVI